MIQKADQFRNWLIDKRFFRVGWFTKGTHTTSEVEESLTNLPEEISKQLEAAVNNLTANSHETQAVLEPLEDAIAQWIENPNGANNSIVILAQPVSPVSLILGESLSQLKIKEKRQLDIKLIDWVERPPHSNSIRGKLEDQLDIAELDRSQEEQYSAEQITIVPNLCWCFLRSAQGLNGIDYIQDSVMNNNAQFVVLGCGQIGWEYLKSTLKFHAYCDQVVHLPELTGKQLQEWIEPILSQFDVQFSDAALHKRIGDPNQLEDIHLSIEKPFETISEITQEATATAKSSLRSVKEALEGGYDDSNDETSPKREYFDRLADISDGVSIVALQLFIRSLCYRKVIDPTQKDMRETDEASNNQIVARLPKLPPLPDLSQNDLYLLYSLMLHGDLTIRSLAESLGDSTQVVNNQVQMLRNEGIIEQKNGVIKANPIHYPRLRKELANNNFIVEVS
ncbi:MAG: winged helix-turn-helix transcriptional regulator [Cyanobacteria bacterium P01_D01_bin.1]